MLTIHAVTLFETALQSFLCKGLIKRAHDEGLFKFKTHDLRNFGTGKHKKVDDYPYSAQKSMLLRADVMYDAITSIKGYEDMRLIYMCPKGIQLNQEYATCLYQDLEQHSRDIVLISGYYEGVDERVFEALPIERVSIGDYILNSGDVAIAVMAETLIRQVPGVLGNPECIYEDSHCRGLLEAPKYTQPASFKGLEVPALLRSGNHQAIARYTEKMALYTTLVYRPDILGTYTCSESQKKLITEIIKDMAEK